MRDHDSYGTKAEVHLMAMEATVVRDQASAHSALGHALAGVAALNETAGQIRLGTDTMDSPVASLAEVLEKWLQRLLDKLIEIVKTLAHGTTFSLSVGTGVSVAINFPEMS